MKMRNRILSLTLLAILMVSLAMSAFATTEGGITPYFNNMSTAEATFIIDENGIGTITYTCRGYRGITTSIVVDTKIEKQSGSSWVQVEGASWTDRSTLYYCINEHSVQLTEGGTYKATLTYTVSGSGGADDVITREIEKTY
ncbi:MAG: hypothetical protein E7596_02160 [Ruminococcaceae bacterium]|nr:hypothetical protein [Oscillospiraceae bacterium]